MPSIVYAEHNIFLLFLLSVVILSVVILGVVMMNVIMLSVVILSVVNAEYHILLLC